MKICFGLFKMGSKLLAMAMPVWRQFGSRFRSLAIDNSLKTHADIFKPGAIIPFLQFTRHSMRGGMSLVIRKL